MHQSAWKWQKPPPETVVCVPAAMRINLRSTHKTERSRTEGDDSVLDAVFDALVVLLSIGVSITGFRCSPALVKNVVMSNSALQLHYTTTAASAKNAYNSIRDTHKIEELICKQGQYTYREMMLRLHSRALSRGSSDEGHQQQQHCC